MSDDPDGEPCQAISRAEAERIGTLQEAHFAAIDVVRTERTVGGDAACRAGTTLLVERPYADVAAVWERLTFPARRSADARIVCTPGLRVAGYPDGRVIAVDLEERVTRICGTDFPGEVKRAGLRGWARLAWDRGGLALHAAVKITHDGRPVVIAGRPGAGKSSIAFASSAITTPCQEDRVAWMPHGTLVGAENAFFAPAHAEGPRPLVERALLDDDSLLVNVSQNGHRNVAGPVGRVVFAAPGPVPAAVPWALILLVRNQNVLPPLARVDHRTAVAMFTAGQAELRAGELRGSMRSTLGSSPLFPLAEAAEGLRLLELLEQHGTPAYVMNTGRVGGPQGCAGSYKIGPADSAALVDAICVAGIEWGEVDELGCRAPSRVHGSDVPPEVLDPRRLYERGGRMGEYTRHVERLRALWDAALAAVELERAVTR